MTKHILIAEDEPMIAMLLEDTLVDAGHRVTVAMDGEKALAAWHQDRADLVITDVGMPRMNGIELVQHLRGFDENLPVLVMTGWEALTPDAERLMVSQPDHTAVLAKPAKLDEIERQVERLLR